MLKTYIEKFIVRIIDIMGYELLLILGLALLIGIIVSVIKWTIIIYFLRGRR